MSVQRLDGMPGFPPWSRPAGRDLREEDERHLEHVMKRVSPMKSTNEPVCTTSPAAPPTEAGHGRVTGSDQPLVINGKAGLTYQLKARLREARSDQLVMTRRQHDLELCFGCRKAAARPEIILENYYHPDAEQSGRDAAEHRAGHGYNKRLGEMYGICADLEDGATVYYRLGDGKGALTAMTSFGVWQVLLDLLGMADIAAMIAQRHACQEALRQGVAASSMRRVVMPIGRQKLA